MVDTDQSSPLDHSRPTHTDFQWGLSFLLYREDMKYSLTFLFISLLASTAFAQSEVAPKEEAIDVSVVISELTTEDLVNLMVPETGITSEDTDALAFRDDITAEHATEDDSFLVWAVAQSILEIHVNQGQCGSYCSSERRDRDDILDRAEFVLTPDYAWEMARVIVHTSHEYNVPLGEVWATARQESVFHPYALGSGTECGMFQQSTAWIRWDSPYFDESREELDRYTATWGAELEGQEAICAYLLDPYNAGFHFALKYHHNIGRHGEANWSAYYNSGPSMWRYQRDHNNYRDVFEFWLDRTVSEYVTTETFYDLVK